MKSTQSGGVQAAFKGFFGKISENVRETLFLNITAGVISLLFSTISIFGRMTPFGVAAVAASGGVSALFSFVGAFLGYAIVGLSPFGVRYIGQILIVTVIKWAFAPYFETEQKWAKPLVAAAVNLAVGSLFLIGESAVLYDLVYLVSESVICAGAVYFLSRSFEVLENGSIENGENVVAVSVCTALSLMSLSAVRVGFFSLGNIVAAFIIMSMAHSLGAFGGACAGLSIGVAISLYSGDGGFAAMAFGLGGMISGLFNSASRFALAPAFLVCTLLAVSISGEGDRVYLLYETIAASAIFLTVPERFIKLVGFYFPSSALKANQTPNKYLASRLDFVSKSLLETSRSICDMSDKLSAGAFDMDKVFSLAADRVCRRCNSKLNCWDSLYTDTMDGFNHLIPPLKSNGKIKSEDIPAQLRHRCIKLPLLTAEINSAYQNLCKQQQFSLRCKHIKDVVTEQFSGMSSLLCEMSQELSLTMCDESTENKISGELLKEGLNVRDVCCPVDRFGRKSVEFYLLSDEAGKLDEALIEENISELCGTKMLRETDVKTGEVTRLSFSQEPPYKVKTAYFQKNAEGEKVCGDSFAFLRLNNGFWAAILSDGMGSGKSAALDSKMTVNLVSRFLKLGFPLSNTASLVNSALMIKSEDETLSTLDAAVFDLYSGSVSLKKAGAAPTYLKRGRRVSKVEMGALPLGILSDVKIRGTDLRLSKGDCVVMCSDGLCALKDSQIESVLKKSDNMSLEQIANRLGTYAFETMSEGESDDITVLVMRLE